MRNSSELATRIRAVAFMTSSVMQSIANNGCPDNDTLHHVGLTLEMEMLSIAHSVEDEHEKNSK